MAVFYGKLAIVLTLRKGPGDNRIGLLNLLRLLTIVLFQLEAIHVKWVGSYADSHKYQTHFNGYLNDEKKTMLGYMQDVLLMSFVGL